MPHSVGIGAEFGLVMPALVTGERAPRLDATPEARGSLPRLVPSVPPSLVIDDVGPIGARERLERADESPLIGTGMDWPLAATLMGGAGSLRMPIPLLLACMCAPDINQTWRTNIGSWRNNADLDPIDKLFAMYLKRSFERLRESAVLADRVVIGVPNAMALSTMTRVLNITGRAARFVWRPVAALISAIQAHAEAFDRVDEDDRALVIYMGIDGFEATVLHLIRRAGEKGPEIVVPGRLRVGSENNVHKPLAGLLRWMRDRDSDGVDGQLPQAWARAWLCQCTERPGGLATHDWVNGPWDPIERMQSNGPWGWFGQRVVKGDSGECYRTAASSFRQDVAGLISNVPGLSHVLLAGNFASQQCELIQSILGQLPRNCQVIHDRWGVVKGAALFGWREQMKWATYSDYLPQLDLCVERAGVPLWLPVVQSDWIDAGIPYRNQQTGFKLQKPPSGKTNRQVELAVSMEGHEHVRETQDVVHFPQDACSDDVPLIIQIEVQAASGEPKVTAEPEGDMAPIVLDWGIATDTRMSKEEYLANRPRSFPPIERVRAARWWYQPVQYRTMTTPIGASVTPKQYVVSELLPGLRRGVINRDKLGEFRKHIIRRNWNRDDLVWDALTSTDGEVQLHQDVMDELRDGLFEWLRQHLDPHTQDERYIRRDVIKVLAWSGFKSASFEQLVIKRMSHDRDWIHAIGSGIQSPRRAAAAINYLAALVDTKLFEVERGEEVQGVNDPLKQLAWLLAQRDGISSETPSEAMHALVASVFQCAVNLEQSDNLAVKFRWAVRCMLLCLMHRRQDPEFLDPSCDLARKMLRFCGKLYLRIGPDDEFAQKIARELHLKREASREPVKALVARDLRTFIGYLERRGTGSIIVEDDGLSAVS